MQLLVVIQLKGEPNFHSVVELNFLNQINMYNLNNTLEFDGIFYVNYYDFYLLKKCIYFYYF